MSLPTEYAITLLHNLEHNRVENLIAQTDARRILQEVGENPENYPNFDSILTEKSTYIAYTMISCGCSLIENEDGDTTTGFVVLEKAGQILSDAYRFNRNENDTKNLHLLIAGMSLYAAKQYSRALIVLNAIEVDFTVGQIIVNFIKKDFDSMLKVVNHLLFTKPPEQLDFQEFDEWVITHEIARCFYIIRDFIFKGKQDSFTLIKDILDKLLNHTSGSNLTLHWLIIRILRIMFFTFQASSLWTVLPPLLPAPYIRERYIRLLSGFRSPVVEIWPSQTEALPLALGDNNGAVINLRTSGGKTRVAEIAILNTLSIHMLSKVLYLAPFRSLAFEIEHSLTKTFGPIGITVSQLYGGSTVNATDFEIINDSQVVIATPEKAKALIRYGSRLEKEIKLIVVDEGHLLGKEERYIRNEMFLTHIKEYASRNEIRMLLLSAVLPNAEDLATWITGDANLVAKSDWKPALERLGLLLWDGKRVRLEWKSEGEPFNPNFIQSGPLGFGRRRNPFPNNKNEAIAATAVRLSQNGTVMIYSARANAINGLAEKVLLALGPEPVDYLWDKSLWNVFERVCSEELNNNDIVLRAARKGVICHNNRLPTLVRIAIERLMRSKPPLIIIASSTLGQGVNVGISTVIVSTPYQNEEVINKRDFWNICGRAGRAFSDAEGKILYAIDTTKSQWQVNKDRSLAHDYFENRQLEKVRSGLLAVLMTIFRIANNTGTNFELLVETIANDFVASKIDDDFSKWVNSKFDIIDDELLAMHEDFNEDEENIDWIDDVFRNSLALIQADTKNEELYISLIKARATGLLKRIPNRVNRKKLISSSIPISVSYLMLGEIDFFRNLGMTYVQSVGNEDDHIQIVDNIVRELEVWSNQKASHLMNFVPLQTVLDNIRRPWISGVTLASITMIENDAEIVSKDYYGYTLPWIIHAISQIFDREIDENLVNLYTSIATFIELGLPNNIAVNIYMAGVKSRRVALELSSNEVFKDKSISEIKKALADISISGLSEDAVVWIEMFKESYRREINKNVSFPSFRLKNIDFTENLYLQVLDSEYYLTSGDGYFFIKVESSNELPFTNIANITGLYFQNIKGIWNLRSYNPQIAIDEDNLYYIVDLHVEGDV